MGPFLKIFGIGSTGSRIVGSMSAKKISSVEYFAADGDPRFAGAGGAFKNILLTLNKNADKLAFESAVKGAELIVIVAALEETSSAYGVGLVIEAAAAENICVYSVFNVSDENKPFVKKLRELMYGAVFLNLYSLKSEIADEIITEAVNTVVVPATVPSVINMEKEEIVRVVKGGGLYFGVGTGEINDGDKLLISAKRAIGLFGPENIVTRTEKMLIWVEGGVNLSLDVTEKLLSFIRGCVKPSAELYFAASINDGLSDEVKVSLLASTSS